MAGRLAAAWLAIKQLWDRWSLSRRFAACAPMVLIPAMAIIGVWITSKIKESAVQNAAAATALYVENFIEPHVQELSFSETLPDDDMRVLGELLTKTPLGQRVVTIKIWGPGNRVVFSTRLEQMGHAFEAGHNLRQAWQGTVSSSFEALSRDEHRLEKSLGRPLLEVYAPMRARGTDRIIAVVEFYETAEELSADLFRTTLQAWALVATVTLSMLAALFAIVHQGSRTIARQKVALEHRINHLTRLLAENRQLRERAQSASARASETNEYMLRRVGSDLHDGPAQLVSLALLRLDEVDVAQQGGQRETSGSPVGIVREALRGALKNIRDVSAGLALPEIEKLSLGDAVRLAIAQHERLTSTKVEIAIERLPATVPQATKICAYRFVQEGLNNAFRHAGGKGQEVSLKVDGAAIVIEVADRGDGIKAQRENNSINLGLRGLADRVDSLGGAFSIDARTGGGTRIAAVLPGPTEG